MKIGLLVVRPPRAGGMMGFGAKMRKLRKARVKQLSRVLLVRRGGQVLVRRGRLLSAQVEVTLQVSASPPALRIVAEDVKRQAFLRLRHENYQASLRLEGLQPLKANSAHTLATLKAKYVR